MLLGLFRVTHYFFTFAPIRMDSGLFLDIYCYLTVLLSIFGEIETRILPAVYRTVFKKWSYFAVRPMPFRQTAVSTSGQIWKYVHLFSRSPGGQTEADGYPKSSEESDREQTPRNATSCEPAEFPPHPRLEYGAFRTALFRWVLSWANISY